MYVLAEVVNGEKTTDYACAPVEVDLVEPETYAVTVKADPAEVKASATEAAEGATVTLIAMESGGYEFVRWTVAGEGASVDDATKLTATLTVGTADVTATANFRKKEGPGPEPTPTTSASVTYRGHAQDVGDLPAVKDGATLGTVGESKRLELFEVCVSGIDGASISYRAHLQDTGWGEWVKDGDRCGTVGESRRIEAVQMTLSGADSHHVWYRVHCQDYGWLGWTCDGREAGTTGLSRRAEAIDVQVLPQGQVPSGYDANKAACVSA